MAPSGQGPLAGIRVLELAGIGPAPFCAMLLADLGADVIRVDRVQPVDAGIGLQRKLDVALRGRRSIAVDMALPAGRDVVLALADRADVLVEGFRPGVAEKLGIGPEACHARNPRLVYGRMTGYGREGPMAMVAGHDLNYLAVTGALAAMGPADGKPMPPLNLVADYGGGALYLAMGILAALLERQNSGRGQTVDAAMIDGVASMLGPFAALAHAGKWTERRGTNMLDGGAPFYDVYETSDGRHVSISAIEGRFFTILRERLGLEAEWDRRRFVPGEWPKLRTRLAEIFRGRTLAEWCEHMDGHDACFAPVLTMTEAAAFDHNRQRGLFAEVDGVVHAAPAPRFDRTPAATPGPIPAAGAHSTDILRELGLDDGQIRDLVAAGAAH